MIDLISPNEKCVDHLQSGCYQLFLWLIMDRKIEVGKLGNLIFPAGYYIYIGSHQRSLFKRVQRHIVKDKKIHWHIDYLTTHRDFEIQNVIFYPGSEDEGQINKSFQEFSVARVLHPGFGNSDCRYSCESHLLYLEFKKYIDLSLWMKLFPSAELF